jgi:hypothetical protein
MAIIRSKEIMKSIKFNGEISNESIKTLLIDIDKVLDDGTIIIYFCSGGGTVSDKDDLVDYINRNVNKFELVCNWEMSSAAFDILLEVHCKIRLNGTFGKIHLYSNTLSYYNLRDKASIDSFLIEDLDNRNKVWIEKLIKCGFSKDEISSIKLGNDIIVKTDRMKKIVSILNPLATVV